jgi:diguanylate cyclase (GGDEF)-like protein
MPSRGDFIQFEQPQDDRTCADQPDCLTGVATRAAFMKRLMVAMRTTHRNPRKRFSVLLLDFDHFRIVNTSLGHAAGDALLRSITERMQTALDALLADFPGTIESIHLARFGGDEFAVLVGGLLDEHTGEALAGAIIDALLPPHALGNCELTAKASFGIVADIEPYESVSEIIRDVETAMYKAKAEGRGRVCVFTHSMHDDAVKRLTIETELRSALRNDEFVLHYQPIVDLNTGELRGFEALVRWQKPDGTMVPPLDFIPIAEETKLVLPLGWWVLEEASRQLKVWQERYPLSKPLTMNINLSKVQLLETHFVEDCGRFLKHCGVEANTIKLEVTESIIMGATDSVTPILYRLRELGLGLSMDDFGTGHSSLSCLSHFPIDVLKIDRAFIKTIEKERGFSAIVQAIITLAHNLNMQVVAEGIETPEQVAQLQALECDLAQGFLFAKPMPANEAEELLATGMALSRSLCGRSAGKFQRRLTPQADRPIMPHA